MLLGVLLLVVPRLSVADDRSEAGTEAVNNGASAANDVDVAPTELVVDATTDDYGERTRT
jgi:hypothetical protein